MNFEFKDGKTVMSVNDIKKQWSNEPIHIAIGSDKVSDFYPSRINLEYMSDNEGNLYLVKNKGWDSYLGIPTVLDFNFLDNQVVTKEEILSGKVITVSDYNQMVLSIANSKFGIDSPDNLYGEALDKGIQDVVSSIDELVNTYKYIEQGKTVDELSSDTIHTLSNITLNMEVLGSVYLLYRARKRILKRS